MDNNSRLNLTRLLNDNEVEQTTEKIRNLRHSYEIKEDVDKFLSLKRQYSRLSNQRIKDIATTRCNFLFNNYTNIFNRLVNDELDVNILYKFIDTLRRIEEGEIDQHEASYEVGSILKRMYVDSAVRREQKQETDNNSKTYRKPVNNISWSNFKLTMLPE